MRLRQGSVERYRDALGQLGEQAAEYVATALATAAETDVAALREIAIDAIASVIDVQGSVAQALAMQLYDAICMAEGIDTNPAVMFPDAINRAMMVEKVHYYARDLVAGMRDKFDKEASDLAEYYVFRCAYENTVRNCGINNMRYARIPTGPDTCPWCLMLASRGFVYYTEHDAMAGCHRHCDCVAVPGRGGYSFNDATQVEGYDPDAYYQLWRESGFMPPKTNPMRPDGTYQRMVYNEDAGTGSNPRKRSNRGVRKLIESRHSMPSTEMNELIRRLNAAKDANELGEIYRDIIGDMLRSHQTILDGDWEEISGHYYYTLKELESGKRTNSDPGFEVLSPKHADAKRKKKRR